MKQVETTECFGLEAKAEPPANRIPPPPNKVWGAYTQRQHKQGEAEEYWQAPRLPHQFLHCLEPEYQHEKHYNTRNGAIYRGTVEYALQTSQIAPTTKSKTQEAQENQEIKSVRNILRRWNSGSSYLGSTLPSVVFLLEKYGYDQPQKAVRMAALVTQDKDICAAIVGAVMGALHGHEWCKGFFTEGQQTPDSLQNLINQCNRYFDTAGKM